jgi:DNA-binding transcriptional MerR regulator
MNAVFAAAPAEGWGLDDFLDTIAAELTRLGISATPPDRRTIRYYATVGVLDRPTLSGREARYADRHLAQVLALKKLQAHGVRLAAISQRLTGASTAELAELATGGVPEWPSPEPVPTPTRTRPTESFSVRHQSVVTLAPGVHLVVDDTTLTPTEAATLTNAATGLLTRLSALGIDAGTRKE